MSRPGEDGYNQPASHLRRPSYAEALSGSGASFPTESTRALPPVASGVSLNFQAYSQISSPDSARATLRIAEDELQAGSVPSASHIRLGQSVTASQAKPDFQPNSLSAQNMFIPSYLRGTKYAERLVESLRTRTETQTRLLRTPSTSNLGTLSTSSSTINLQRQNSHRGLSFSIVEKSPENDPDVQPLPSQWSEMDKSSGLELSGENLEVRFIGPRNNNSEPGDVAAAVRADRPMPVQSGVYYYEVSIMSKGKESQIGIGFCTSKVLLNKLPGWDPDSWGYHGDDGKFFASTQSTRPYGPHFGNTDVVGCGVNFKSGQAFFTRNGYFLGYACGNLNKGSKLYPAVGMQKQGEQVRVNFGRQPFTFNIESYMRKEKLSVEQSLSHSSIGSSLDPYDEDEVVQYLVAQYLAYGNYLHTCEAFQTETRKEIEAVEILESKSRPRCLLSASTDLHVDVRYRIRNAILNGDVTDAVSLTDSHFPTILEKNNSLYFRLRCLKFVELIRKWAATTSLANASVPIKPSKKAYDEMFDATMDLDEPSGTMNGHADAADVSYERKQSNPIPNDLWLEIRLYGKQLWKEFKNDPRKEVRKMLDETISLIGYEEPENSTLSHLMNINERIPVAEDLNKAILASLGRSDRSSLEWLFRASDALATELSNEGGPAAFLNLRDYIPADYIPG